LNKVNIALVGNPNSGKTTLFNALTGSKQYVGNWPGVTVEKIAGELKGRPDVSVTDLPGIYSLSPYSPEEVIARDYLTDERPDVILNIVDSTNLARNLFLTTQLTELGIPIVVALNMTDAVAKKGDKIDAARLSAELNCAVLEISALKGTGVPEAADAALNAAKAGKTLPRYSFSGSVEHTLAHIEEAVLHDLPQEEQRFFSIKLLERDEHIIKKLGLTPEQIAHIESDIKQIETAFDDDSESIITSERYTYIDTVIKDCVKIKNKGKLSGSERIDRVATNRFLALPVFAAVMFVVYFVSVTLTGAFVTDFTSAMFFGKLLPNAADGFLASIDCADWLRGLITDGVIGGVGAVLGFVPQIMVLFIFLAFLEGSGYMSRIAFILDRVFRKFGLSGKSFIPILIGTGCGVPGIMASRTIEDAHDRRMTVITTTFIPCSAKLPVIALIAGALFDGAWWVASSAYFIGITAIICSGLILKKTKLFAGSASPFIMELPPYRLPTARNVLKSMWERAWSFIRKAGTVVLFASVIIWFASNYGWNDDGAFGAVEAQNSVLAVFGGVIAWIFIPLGWGNWQTAAATVTGLIAKENIVGSLGILYGFAGDAPGAWAGLSASFTPLSAYSFLVFNLLCAPCVAALSAIRKEMDGAKWFWFAVAYQSFFAYLVSLCVYQIGMIFFGSFGIWTIAAIISLCLIMVLLLRPTRNKNSVSQM
jgi:ferrous iron transport protein B